MRHTETMIPNESALQVSQIVSAGAWRVTNRVQVPIPGIRGAEG